jgi:NADH dehydrogenase
MARLVTVFGGSGFVGRHLVRRLAAEGDRVRIAVRDPEDAHFLKPAGNVGQIVAVPANVRHEGSVRAAVQGADAVINLVGRIAPSGRNTLDAVHVEGARRIAAAARAAGVKHLVHLSALGADAGSRSPYLRSKAAGEAAVREAFPDAVILRPSLIFGPEDQFFNRFAQLTGYGPALPVIGHASFQPVYVGDVAEAILRGINRPECAGQTFSLGGPRVYTMQQILEMVLAYTNRDRALIPVAMVLMQIQAFVLQFVPGKPLTPDQLRLLTSDNLVPEGAPGFAALGIQPTAAEAIVPTYLARFSNPYARQTHPQGIGSAR